MRVFCFVLNITEGNVSLAKLIYVLFKQSSLETRLALLMKGKFTYKLGGKHWVWN